MKRLNEMLEDILPKDCQFEIYHLKSPAKEIPGFKNRSFSKCNSIVKSSHFLSVAYKGKIFFAIDINVYFEIYENKLIRTIFVSKADTNGFLQNSNVKVSQIVETFISYLIRLPPILYLNKVIPLNRSYGFAVSKNIITKKSSVSKGFKILSKRYTSEDNFCIQNMDKFEKHLFKNFACEKYTHVVTKLSLFTRPEPHYLFTNSGSNPEKHLLSGEKLLNWWLKIVDNLLKTPELFKKDSSLRGTLELPGEDRSFVKRRYLNHLSPLWDTGTIYGDYSEGLYHIPIFHDDPKTRFLKDLIVENKYDVIKLKDFWKELEVRQEFRSGIVVGVIGVTGTTTFEGSIENTPDSDTLIAPSKARYKQIKSYIVGEQYDKEEAAIDARNNLTDIWNGYSKININVTGKLKIDRLEKKESLGEIKVLTFRRKNKN